MTGARVSLQGFSPTGSVLDVGAGGECVVARALRRRITGLELRPEEVAETVGRGLGGNVDWVVGDARELPFQDESFDAVTFFFTLMYMATAADRRRAMAEAARVLKAGRRVYVWDFVLPGASKGFVGLVDVTLPGGEGVRAGYGFRGEHAAQTAADVRLYLEEAGLRVVEERAAKEWFFLAGQKPLCPSGRYGPGSPGAASAV